MGLCQFNDDCGEPAVVALTLLESTSLDALTELCALHALCALSEWLARPRDDWVGWTIEWLPAEARDLTARLRSELGADVIELGADERAYLSGVLGSKPMWARTLSGTESRVASVDVLEIPRCHAPGDDAIFAHCRAVLTKAAAGAKLHVALFGDTSYGAVALPAGPVLTSTLQPTD